MFTMNRDAIDFNSADIGRLFRQMFFPTLAGMLSIAVITVTDGIFVGQGVGGDALAAINIFCPLWMVMTGISLMFGAGGSVVIAVHLSQGKQKAADINMTQSLAVATLLALTFIGVMRLFGSEVAAMLGCSERLLPYYFDYAGYLVPSFLFYIWGGIGLFLIRLDGSPRYAMACNMASAAVNVVLDYLFIFPMGMGIKGAAIATALSGVTSGVMAMSYILLSMHSMKLYGLKPSMKSLRLTLRNIGYQCRIGSSALLGELAMAFMMFIGNIVFMKYLGEEGVAAFSIACYCLPMVFMVGNAVAQSAQPIISYHYGAGNFSNVGRALRISLLTACLSGAAVTAAIGIWHSEVVGMFIDRSDGAFAIADNGLPTIAVGFLFFITNLTFIGYYQSIKQVGRATLYTFARGFLFVFAFFMLLPELCGTTGIWLAMPAAEAATLLLILATHPKTNAVFEK